MTIETNHFQWSDIISITENTYSNYLKLDDKNKDKYVKAELQVTYTQEAIDDLRRFSGLEDPLKILRQQLVGRSQDEMCKLVFRHMKYHCGKPLRLTLGENEQTYRPILDYFNRNEEYLSDYDYMIMDIKQYTSLLNSNFPLFESSDWNQISSSESSLPISKIAKYRNLDVYVTWHFPDKDLQTSERLLSFDCIIGKTGWIEADIIKMDPEIMEGSNTNKMFDKCLLKMSFPIKRGFIKIKSI